MKSTTTISLAIILCFGEVRAAPPPTGFIPLFSGKDLAGWRGGATFDHRKLLEMPEMERTAQIAKWTAAMSELNPKTGKPHWHVEGDELVNDGLGAYASTAKDYDNFELRLEYKTVAGADSGIYLRGVPQVQIWDINQTDQPKSPDRRPRLGSGGLFNNSVGSPGRQPLVVADKPFGEWNQVRVVMVGSRVSVWLNQKLVVDHAILENYHDAKLPSAERRPVPPRGPIQLQTHGGEIRWRNVFLRKIGSNEAGRILASHGGERFKPIFNGRDLTGWAGDVDMAEARDGAIVWRQGKKGTLYWNETLADFRVRLFFKVPPGGNNGLAIRYPGTGVAAYDGMTEIQVLDENYEKVKGKIDPRQAHGSAAQMVAAVRGYQHPIGEWNFQEVTVQGSSVTVDLNGTIILDTDLTKVDLTKILGNRPQTGRDRKEGFFGFAGHDDPVAFKEISVRRM